MHERKHPTLNRVRGAAGEETGNEDGAILRPIRNIVSSNLEGQAGILSD
jgi:hypothetical protein